jgi:hypothetical protein
MSRVSQARRRTIGPVPVRYRVGFRHLIKLLPPELCPIAHDFRPMGINVDLQSLADLIKRFQVRRRHLFKEV